MSKTDVIIDKQIKAGDRPADVSMAIGEIEQAAKMALNHWGPDVKMVMHLKLEVEKPDGD